MGHMCYLCRRKTSKRDRISLHKFPKNPVTRNKWIKACDLSPTDNLTYIYICSMHFNTKDMDRGNESRNRCTLRTGAVPSIAVPNQIFSNDGHINTLNDGIENIAKTNKVETIDRTLNQPLWSRNARCSNLFDPASTALCRSPFENQHLHCCLRRPVVSALVTVDATVNENVKKSEESYFTMPKGRVEPRYISKIRTPDLETPKRTKRILNFVRNTNKREFKLLKFLQDRIRKVGKRITSLEQIIAANSRDQSS